MTDLLGPFDLGGLSLPNRIVMSPMTRTRATEDDVSTDLMRDYYVQRATAGLHGWRGGGSPNLPRDGRPGARPGVADWGCSRDAYRRHHGRTAPVCHASGLCNESSIPVRYAGVSGRCPVRPVLTGTKPPVSGGSQHRIR